MKPQAERLILGLLLAALTAVDLAAWRMTQTDSWPGISVVGFYSLGFSQVSLAAIWSGMTRGRLSARVVLPLSAIVVWTLLMETEMAHQYSLWALLLALQVIAIAVPLCVLKWLGIFLERSLEIEGETTSVSASPLQFDLRHVLIWITVIAVVLALVRAIRVSDSARADLWPNAMYLAAGFATIALVAVWSALGSGHVLVKLPFLVIISAGVGLALSKILREGSDPKPFCELAGFQGVLLAAYLHVLNRSGYRLLKSVRSAPQSFPAVPADIAAGPRSR